MKISGKILDENNVPLYGANLIYQGNNAINTSTNKDGSFVLDNAGIVPFQTFKISHIGYKEQFVKASDLVNKHFNQARKIIRGEIPIPDDIKGISLITAMEDYINKNPNEQLASELANSPLVSQTSEAAQTLRLAAERLPDSAIVRLLEIKNAREAKVANIEKNRTMVKDKIKKELNTLQLTKDDLQWDKFLNSILC